MVAAPLERSVPELKAPSGGTNAMRRVSWKPIRSVAIVAVLYALVLSFIPLAARAQTATSSLLVKLAVGLSPDQPSQVIGRNGGIEISAIPAFRLYVIQVVTADGTTYLADSDEK